MVVVVVVVVVVAIAVVAVWDSGAATVLYKFLEPLLQNHSLAMIFDGPCHVMNKYFEKEKKALSFRPYLAVVLLLMLWFHR